MARVWVLMRQLLAESGATRQQVIGCGLVCHGEVYTNANGSAGDVGQICADAAGRRCHCGNLGGGKVVAAGAAIVPMAV